MKISCIYLILFILFLYIHFRTSFTIQVFTTAEKGPQNSHTTKMVAKYLSTPLYFQHLICIRPHSKPLSALNPGDWGLNTTCATRTYARPPWRKGGISFSLIWWRACQSQQHRRAIYSPAEAHFTLWFLPLQPCVCVRVRVWICGMRQLYDVAVSHPVGELQLSIFLEEHKDYSTIYLSVGLPLLRLLKALTHTHVRAHLKHSNPRKHFDRRPLAPVDHFLWLVTTNGLCCR